MSTSLAAALPPVWPGFVLAAVYLVAELAEDLIPLEAPISMVVGFLGVAYWLAWVYFSHQALRDHTAGQYPISPRRAAFLHFIPFYNLGWMFRWPEQLSRYLNEQRPGSMVHGLWVGPFILVGFITTRVVDGALGLSVMFGVAAYVGRCLRQYLRTSR